MNSQHTTGVQDPGPGWEPDPDDDPELQPGPCDDPDCAVPAELESLTWAELWQVLEQADQITAADLRAEALLGAAVGAAMTGASTAARRGPGYSGQLAPGVYRNRTAGFANGGALDTAAPCAALAVMVEDAAGPDGTYPGASADEILGAVCALDRLQGYLAACKYQAVAAFIKCRPAQGAGPEVPGGLPRVWHQNTGAELAVCLADSLRNTETLVETAYQLAGQLPGTAAALRSGDLREDKARIIVRATVNLTPAEAGQAEDLVLDRAGRLTPGGVRAAISRAVMQVNPDALRQWREDAAKTRRVEVRPEESGNGSVSVRELSAADVAAIDQELSARARELKKAGAGADTDDRRVLAFLERFGLAPALPGNPAPAPAPGPAGTPGGRVPAGVRGSLNLTVPLVTLLGLADRPGEAGGFGPVDPDLARDLARQVLAGPADNPVCLTVTGQDGKMIAHGCGRPATKAGRTRSRAKNNRNRK